MKYTLFSLALALAVILGIFIGSLLTDESKSGKPVVIDGVGVVEIRQAQWKKGGGEMGSREFLDKIYKWYIHDEMIPQDHEHTTGQTIIKSIKNSPAIIISHGKIPYKRFWIPVVSRPALIGVEHPEAKEFYLFSIPDTNEIFIDFVE